jgi:hypothetical protein
MLPVGVRILRSNIQNDCKDLGLGPQASPYWKYRSRFSELDELGPVPFGCGVDIGYKCAAKNYAITTVLA